jgi:serine phosphatase RsbU (regulator of sigma subunit)
MALLRRKTEDPAQPDRWPRVWLILCGIPALAAVAAYGLHRFWAGSWSLDPLLAVSPAMAGVGTTTVRRPVCWGAVMLAVAGAAAALSKAPLLSPVCVVPAAAVACVTGLSALGVGRSTLGKTGQRLADVTSVAEAAQRALLRPMPDQVGPLKLGVVYQAAAAEARVGGDLYEVADTRHGIRLIIGDVRGKGLDAIELAADVLGMFREVAHEVYTLAELARRLDVGLSRRRKRGFEEFVTALLVEVSPESGELSIYNCGHPAPVLLQWKGTGSKRRRSAALLEVPAPAPPLRLMSLGDTSGAGRTVAFTPGAALLLYTDGVTEARDAQQRFYPLTERLAHLAGEHRRGRRSGLLDRLRDDLIRHVGAPLEDDAALVLIQAPAAWDSALDGETTGSLWASA